MLMHENRMSGLMFCFYVVLFGPWTLPLCFRSQAGPPFPSDFSNSASYSQIPFPEFADCPALLRVERSL